MSDASKIDDGGLYVALKSERDMDCYLEERSGSEIISDIRSVMAPTLTLRDYFAAAALTGLLAYPEADLNCGTAPDAARTAYELADAMIAASKTGGPEHG